jgi:exodeoxyribonuclease V beta subunit
MTGIADFDLDGDLPSGWLLLEASAGTGKTYALTALVARYVVEQDLRTEQLLMVTFTRAAAAEMREKTRQQLAHVLAVLMADTVPDETPPWMARIAACSDTEREVYRRRLETAMVTIDAATITTIHGFFQRALAEVGLGAGDLASAELAEDNSRITSQLLRDELVSLLAADPDILAPISERSPNKIEADLHTVVKELSGNLSARPAPTPGNDPAPVAGDSETGDSDTGDSETGDSETGDSETGDSDTGDGAADTANAMARRWSALVSQLIERIRATRIASGVLGFDDLIVELVRLLGDGELGVGLQATLRKRYRLALIDEFQDTDNAMWELFSTTFVPSADPDDPFLALITVADPKQAIYRFRGADIAAYLQFAADPRMATRQMRRNWRSDPALVAVLNSWLAGKTFGDVNIGYVEVDTPASDLDQRLTGAGAPVQLRWLPRHQSISADPPKNGKPPDLRAPLARPVIAVDLANHVVDLLTDGLIHPRSGSQDPRKVQPGDICVLVRSHDDAEPIANELEARNIPVVRSRIGNVLETEVVEQLRILLAALADHRDARRVRALAVGWFVDEPLHLLFDDTWVEQMQTRCLRWAADLEDLGVMGFLQKLRTETDVLLAIARTGEAERRLTDLEHVVELLHVSLDGRNQPAAVVRDALDNLVANLSNAEHEMRRVDSDAKAVQITTIHSSKGLEYPVVLLPYPKAPRSSQPYAWSEHLNGDLTRRVDAAPGVPWALDGFGPNQRKDLAAVEIAGDDLRLLYVAFTRAQHQLVVWWAQTRGANNGPLGRLLFGDTTVLHAAPANPDDEQTETVFTDLASRLGPGFEVRRIPEVLQPSHIEFTTGDHVAAFVPAGFTRSHVANPAWYRWSYSSLTSAAHGDDDGIARGGFDEPDTDAPGIDLVATRQHMDEPLAGRLLDMGGGRFFGSWVHEILEVTDFAADSLNDELRRAIATTSYADADDIDTDDLVAGLADALHTPIDALGGVTLASVAAGDRLPELSFHFPLGDGRSALAVRGLFELAAAHDSPFTDQFARLADDTSDLNFAGLMTGSIDLVLRVPASHGWVYALADHKTNTLHDRANPVVAAYATDAMHAEMVRHDYPVQALVYSVALHRMLSLRLDGYDIDTHLGPSCYLFVRGMTGPDTPVIDGVRNGVFAWRPPSALVLAASNYLGDM